MPRSYYSLKLTASSVVPEFRLQAFQVESLAFSVSPRYYSLLTSWPSCTQRIKEGRNVWQNTRQPHSGLVGDYFTSTDMPSHTYAHTQWTSTHVHNMDKNNISFKTEHYKSSLTLAHIYRSCFSLLICVICRKGKSTSLCISSIDMKYYDCIRWA